MKIQLPSRCGALFVFALVQACALTNKADPLNLRYFAPPANDPPLRLNEARAQEPVTVRIDGVEAAAHLTEAIAYRKNEAELGYYEELRWTEIPNVYLERAVADALFRDGTLRRGLTDSAYRLALTLEAFEKLAYGQPRVRVVTRVWVGDDRVVLSEQRLVIEEPIGDQGNTEHTSLMAAFSRALVKTAAQVRAQLDTVVERTQVVERAENSEPLPAASPTADAGGL